MTNSVIHNSDFDFTNWRLYILGHPPYDIDRTSDLDLKLSVQINNHSYFLKEPIVFAAYLENHSNMPITFDLANDMKTQVSIYDTSSAIVFSERSYVDRPIPKTGFDLPPSLHATLQPENKGEVFYNKINTDSIDALQPGRYRLCASLLTKGLVLKSNEIEFEIKDSLREKNEINQHLFSTTIASKRCRKLFPRGSYDDVRYTIEIPRRANGRVFHSREQVRVLQILYNSEKSNSLMHISLEKKFLDKMHRWKIIGPTGKEVSRIANQVRNSLDKQALIADDLFVMLPQKTRILVHDRPVCLNDYFDLSEPGTYKVKIFCDSLIPGQRFDPPIESNELHFEIVAGEHLTPEDLVDSGTFDDPSKEEHEKVGQ